MCHYCNTSDLIGYDVRKNTNWDWKTAMPVNGLIVAPQSNGFKCSANSEYVDVNFFK